MAVSYNMGFNPIWYIADNVGRPLGGGYLATYRQLNPDQLKLVFEDPAGNFPWPYVTIPNTPGVQGILFDENGSQGPFFFEFDTAAPDETYYLEAYDSSGNLVWTVENYTPNSGGGGSVITTAINLTNIITNNVMWRNLGPTPVATSLYQTLAPGAHAGFSYSNAGLAGPDIVFVKNNLNATDTISFPLFTSNLLTTDVTPESFFQYTCSNTPTAETYKYVQFPITKGVNNLNNKDASVTIWARADNGGTQMITLSWYQWYGDGVETPQSLTTTFANLTLTNTWDQYNVTLQNIPSTAGVTLGGCGNDGLFLQVGMPLGAPCTINFTKPAVYISPYFPTLEYVTYDMIDAVINAPRTGYVFQSFDLVSPYGYLMLDDKTIGNIASGATSNGGRGANVNTFPLYNWLWTNVSSPSSNAWCTVTGGLTDPVSDFLAGKVMNLPSALGRLLASAGTGSGLSARVLGSFLGSETISITDMPSHNHPGSFWNLPTDLVNAAGANGVAYVGNPHANTPVTVAAQGGSGADGKMPPSTFMNWFIKL